MFERYYGIKKTSPSCPLTPHIIPYTMTMLSFSWETPNLVNACFLEGKLKVTHVTFDRLKSAMYDATRRPVGFSKSGMHLGCIMSVNIQVYFHTQLQNAILSLGA